MILRSLTKHVRDQNWFAVGLDFLIVVIGVFIGLQVNNWNETLDDRVKERAYLERLNADFDVIRERLKTGETAFRNSVEAADLLLEASRIYRGKTSGEMPDDEAIKTALFSFGEGRAPSGASAAYNEMVSSGELKLLHNEKLRDKLFEYDHYSDITRDLWKTLRNDFTIPSSSVYGLYKWDAEFQDETSGLVSIIGYDRERLFGDDIIAGNIGHGMALQENQRQIVVLQLTLAEQIEALIAEELEK